ncbi:protein of unknown function [Xenorhabdus poinarii G6]|uniref:Uncharacterized protein n=1 Tax=Xenorhabdus poinarii G6 TaxID=1354304 RepID=A0A068R5L9_9GAMM|nr:protein of unknown function [Xenorhabdus poinarii G6]
MINLVPYQIFFHNVQKSLFYNHFVMMKSLHCAYLETKLVLQPYSLFSIGNNPIEQLELMLFLCFLSIR